MIDKMLIRGAKVHNLKNIDVDIPLHKIVGIAGVSGSGKSSLALGVLYAEGSRRYLESLSTYTRRRMTQASQAAVDEVLYVPAALALHQRPGVPGIRSTFGTGTELLNSLRLIYSRLASHRCPNGHYVRPSLNVAAEKDLVCPECGVHFMAPSAEELAFNSQGACPDCSGTGTVRTVDMATLVPDESISIDDGAVAPWNSLMWSLMTDVCRAMGVRTDVPFRDLTAEEKDIVYHGPAVKKHIFYKSKNSNEAGELDFTYYNAVYTVENALSKVKDEKGMKRVEKFLKEEVCPTCHGTRLSEAARAPKVQGISLDESCTMTLSALTKWVQAVPKSLPKDMVPMADSIVEAFQNTAKRLIDLGLGYLTLDRSAGTLSTGERQRMQLARAVRNRTTGVLYVLDEPSIGLHPANIVGLTGVMNDLVADGNSVILVDHDTQILKEADWIIEMGPKAGVNGGHVLAEGTLPAIEENPVSQIGPFLSGKANTKIRPDVPQDELFANGQIHLSTTAIHTVKPLDLTIPKGRLTVVTGVSGSGKTTMVLESLIPAIESVIAKRPLPAHIKGVDAGGIEQVKLIDATPIGINVRSTVATYAGVHDELRKLYGKSPEAKEQGYKARNFSYNTGSLRCPDCDGTGTISLDVQFLPDVHIPCPTCHGSRYAPAASAVKLTNKEGISRTLPELMAMDVDDAVTFCTEWKGVSQRLTTLSRLGLGYLTLGEETPGLSGGEAQRLKLASEMGRTQTASLFVFDEPSIGLHPLDVQVLLRVFQALLDRGATVVVIEHDLDVIRNADYIIDMGPGGGEEGGRITAIGTPEAIKQNKDSITGQYL
ncbi:excinuclease ABC subunit UvrA [uncultured Megasphaera sp.]|uniref:excinuclease ABC subunit UvrA n=1 Tax=uncultured Megasphaera sp. TaxID=165188 RepID=UPI0025DAA371|nr:excinuclease ABC subunit UvrA [uncultured Megasphaera sp.]